MTVLPVVNGSARHTVEGTDDEISEIDVQVRYPPETGLRHHFLLAFSNMPGR